MTSECLVTDISNNPWYLWIDSTAEFEHDTLCLPPVDISKLPVNPPSCGWDALEAPLGLKITVPATVEQYFWGKNGNTYGVTGDYQGVSWFSTTLDIPPGVEGKRIVLQFESARMRAEVFINRQLAGYNLIDGTQFEVDITKLVSPGSNRLSVRITDPNGDFTWCDFPLFSWGNYKTIPSHAFGGITGKVSLEITDNTWIDDVFIKNKPEINAIDADITLSSSADKIKGSLVTEITKKGGNKVLLSQTTEVMTMKGEAVHVPLSLPDALPWSPDTPELYDIHISWHGADGSIDEASKHFGFRWFEVRDVQGDKQFYLNNKRIFLRTAISWGCWPVNGIFPTPELAEKQILTAKAIGLNMLNFHRTIGQNLVLDKADELGLLYYAEPGGYRHGTDSLSQKWKQIKLLRMVKQFRSHPSLIIYNMENESCMNPPPEAISDIAKAHRLDETRCITYASEYYNVNDLPATCPFTPYPAKLHMLPYSQELLYFGWYDEHHAPGPGVYYDDMYSNPDKYYLNINHPSEIIFYGEEGAIGTPGRFELIKEAILNNKQKGWDSDDYLDIYNAYDQFLTKKGFRKAFPAVDSLTRCIGNMSYYYQGRAIENARINNLVDGYAVNGWEEMKLENHSGIVDCYRNPKGDVRLISRYNQPLYLSVKLRNKVLQTGDSIIADIFIVNEKDINGRYKLTVEATDTDGQIEKKEFSVSVTGGDRYGELLQKDVVFKSRIDGYCSISAKLLENQTVVTIGDDQAFLVSLDTRDIPPDGVIYDTSGLFNAVLKESGLQELPEYKGGKPEADYVLVGNALPKWEYSLRQDLLEWVAGGHTLIIAGSADIWAEFLAQKEIIKYQGKRNLGRLWFGGNYFVRDHPFFTGLPVNTVFNWEYQCFSLYSRKRFGLRIQNDETIVGAVSDHQQEVYSAVSIIQMGKGKIILSTLDISGALKEGGKPAIVAKRVLLNLIRK